MQLVRQNSQSRKAVATKSSFLSAPMGQRIPMAQTPTAAKLSQRPILMAEPVLNRISAMDNSLVLQARPSPLSVTTMALIRTDGIRFNIKAPTRMSPSGSRPAPTCSAERRRPFILAVTQTSYRTTHSGNRS
jgi:hypothetical protein